MLCCVALIGYIVYLDIAVRWKFEGARWAIPAHVYSSPLEMYTGSAISKTQLVGELKRLGYRDHDKPASPGTYTETRSGVDLYVRSFTFWDGPSTSQLVRVRFDADTVAALHDGSGRALDAIRLEPRLYASISPVHHEDRVLIRLDDVPPLLILALLSMEDRNYFHHIGLDPRGLARALWVNLRQGQVVQGGSTLTQQLIKNLYLTQDRTVERKLTEMIMAVLLELHYSKEQILEAYINEVYLGQSGSRAIHGFGLASYFYFGRPLNELGLAEIALLAGLARGASYYNPFRSPQRSKQRRDLVLTKLVELGHVSEVVADRAKQTNLGVVRQGTVATNDHPAFLDFVRLQLRRDYQEEDLRTEGLNIFTTLDPFIQNTVEHAVAQRLTKLENIKQLESGSLEAAVLVVRTDNGEIAALVGGRHARFDGFNRALEAERPIGSLIKPAVYLTAIERGYSLATLLDDSPLKVEQRGAPVWQPQNYDDKFHGQVMLVDALSYSYNVATARLGLEVGVDRVIRLLNRLGLNREMRDYPSLLLGAVNMTPVEVAQYYLGIASGGFRIPLRTTRTILTKDMQPLARYPLSLEQVIDGKPLTMLNHGLQSVVKKGTAKGLNKYFPSRLKLAGKTGTTDGYRDSWFAGYAGNYLTVVWVGRDDNKPIDLSGAHGAMHIWSDIMQEVPLQPVIFPVPRGIEFAEVDRRGRLANGCDGAASLPFESGTLPTRHASCAGGVIRSKSSPVAVKVKTWFERLFSK